MCGHSTTSLNQRPSALMTAYACARYAGNSLLLPSACCSSEAYTPLLGEARTPPTTRDCRSYTLTLGDAAAGMRRGIRPPPEGVSPSSAESSTGALCVTAGGGGGGALCATMPTTPLAAAYGAARHRCCNAARAASPPSLSAPL